MVVAGVVVVLFFLTDYNTSPTKFVLSCFGLLVGLWQYKWRLELGLHILLGAMLMF